MTSKIFKAGLCKTKNLGKLNSANTGPDLISQRNVWRSNFQIFSISSDPWCTKSIIVKTNQEQTQAAGRAGAAHVIQISRSSAFLIFRKMPLENHRMTQVKEWMLPCRVKGRNLYRTSSLWRFRSVESTKCSLGWADSGTVKELAPGDDAEGPKMGFSAAQPQNKGHS